MQVTIREYLERAFSPQSRPSPDTVRQWIKRGELPYPAKRLGGQWYIELDPAAQKPDIDPLFLKVIQQE